MEISGHASQDVVLNIAVFPIITVKIINNIKYIKSIKIQGGLHKRANLKISTFRCIIQLHSLLYSF